MKRTITLALALVLGACGSDGALKTMAALVGVEPAAVTTTTAPFEAVPDRVSGVVTTTTSTVPTTTNTTTTTVPLPDPDEELAEFDDLESLLDELDALLGEL